MEDVTNWQVTFERTVGEVHQTDIVNAAYIVEPNGDACFYVPLVDPDGNSTGDMVVGARFAAGRWILVERMGDLPTNIQD